MTLYCYQIVVQILSHRPEQSLIAAASIRTHVIDCSIAPVFKMEESDNKSRIE